MIKKFKDGTIHIQFDKDTIKSLKSKDERTERGNVVFEILDEGEEKDIYICSETYAWDEFYVTDCDKMYCISPYVITDDLLKGKTVIIKGQDLTEDDIEEFAKFGL